MSDDLRQQIVAEVVAYTQRPELAADEFTRSDYIRETGLGNSAVRLRLESLVARGVLACREVFDPRTRRRAWAYRQVKVEA